MIKLIPLLLLLLIVFPAVNTYYSHVENPGRPVAANNVPFYVSWIVHLHQPLYNINGSITDLLNSPDCPSWLPGVWQDRARIYNGLPADVVGNMTGDEALQIDITGTLVQQLNDLASSGWDNCLFCHWRDKWLSVAGLKTSIGLPRLRILGAGYYHPIFPLIYRSGFKEDFKQQILKHRQTIEDNFGIKPGPGFFPIEESFTPEIIPSLVEMGFRWTVVDSEQVLRATYGYNSNFDPKPNPYDVRNPDPGDWDWAISPQLVFRPHVVEYNGSRLVVFVRYRQMSEAEMSGSSVDYLVSQIQHFEQYNTDPSRPFIMVIVHDGDNGWPQHNYGRDYYLDYLVGFLNKIHSDPSLSYIKVIGLDEYLAKIYNPLNDTGYEYSNIWVEPGSWETMGTWGDPFFAMWNYPDSSSPDQTRWSLYVEAVNYYLTAEKLHPGDNRLQEVLDWIMKGEGSDYYYWDGNQWWDEKAPDAFHYSISISRDIMAGGSDSVPPTVMYAWRTPYNPGGSMTIYFHAYDVSGLSSITVTLLVNNTGVETVQAEQTSTNNLYKADLEIPGQGTCRVIIEAEDNNGNTMEYNLTRPFIASGGSSGGGQHTPFIMDGKLDYNNTIYVNNSNSIVRHLWAVLRTDGLLYVATEPARSGADVFIIIAVNLTNTTVPAPWAKQGTVMQYLVFLGNEADNSWTGWFAANGTILGGICGSAAGTVLEGYIDLKAILGYAPHRVYVAVAAYQTQDGGRLIEVLAHGNGDGNIEASEFVDP